MTDPASPGAAVPGPSTSAVSKSGKRTTPEPKEITAADMLDYLNTESDFGFEISVIKHLRTLHFDVEHGGTYMDDVTGKPRQFDFRATLSDDRRIVRLAVECKNLRKKFPMIVSCLPRSHDEATQHFGFSINNKVFNFHDLRKPPGMFSSGEESLEPRFKRLELHNANTLYREGEPVGKSVAQVGRLTDGKFNINDTEVYQKWAQALSSAVELVSILPFDGAQSPINARFSCVIPVLVVPKGTLWKCGFDFDGNRTMNPVECDRVQIYINKSCNYQDGIFQGTYRLTHIEVVTIDGLTELVARLTHETAILPRSMAIDLIGKLLPLDEDSFGVTDWVTGF